VRVNVSDFLCLLIFEGLPSLFVPEFFRTIFMVKQFGRSFSGTGVYFISNARRRQALYFDGDVRLLEPRFAFLSFGIRDAIISPIT
jgi:hypothetical protein